jgi:adenine/guanine/hypoxanthine permease
MDGALGAAGTSAAAIGLDHLAGVGVAYRGLGVLGGGSILTGLVLGAIGVFIIEREFAKAAGFALAGAALSYFGFMHGEAVGIGGGLGVSPGPALAYAAIAVGLFVLSRQAAVLPAVAEPIAAAAE